MIGRLYSHLKNTRHLRIEVPVQPSHVIELHFKRKIRMRRVWMYHFMLLAVIKKCIQWKLYYQAESVHTKKYKNRIRRQNEDTNRFISSKLWKYSHLLRIFILIYCNKILHVHRNLKWIFNILFHLKKIMAYAVTILLPKM